MGIRRLVVALVVCAATAVDAKRVRCSGRQTPALTPSGDVSASSILHASDSVSPTPSASELYSTSTPIAISTTPSTSVSSSSIITPSTQTTVEVSKSSTPIDNASGFSTTPSSSITPDATTIPSSISLMTPTASISSTILSVPSSSSNPTPSSITGSSIPATTATSASAASTTTVAAKPCANIVPNGGFDSGSVSPWTAEGGAIINGPEARDGNYYYSGDMSTDSVLYVKQTITGLQTNMAYNFRGFFRRNPGGTITIPGYCGITLMVDGRPSGWPNSVQQGTPQNSWYMLSTTFSATTGTVELGVKISCTVAPVAAVPIAIDQIEAWPNMYAAPGLC